MAVVRYFILALIVLKTGDIAVNLKEPHLNELKNDNEELLQDFPDVIGSFIASFIIDTDQHFSK